MRLVLCTVLMGTVLTACSKANASGLDASNPLNCAAQFSRYSTIARQQGDVALAGAFGARAEWYVNRARGIAPERPTDAALEELGRKIVAQGDGGLALATECMKRQDADPDFQRVVREAKRAISEGRGSESLRQILAH